MTCQHLRTKCTQSRYMGEHQALVRDYSYKKSRRHRCLDCGLMFNTLELSEQQLNEFKVLSIVRLRENVLDAMEIA